jgi:hypothetical protein
MAMTMWAEFWTWLQGLSGGAAAFVGSVTGSSLGLLALVVGALYNAHLNRERDDRLRREERRGIAVAIKAELMGTIRTLDGNSKTWEGVLAGHFAIPDVSHSIKVMPRVVEKLGLFDVETARQVMDAYSIIDQYLDRLISLGAANLTTVPEHRRAVVLPADKARAAIYLNGTTADVIREGIAAIDKYAR